MIKKTKKVTNKKWIWFFSLLVILVLLFYQKKSSSNIEEAKKIAEMVTDNHPVSITSNGVIDYGKLQELENTGYEDLKQYLGTKKDFCIYIEDGNGDVILSKGSSKLNDDEVGCVE